ncbi:MAG TPA: hypothetical protein VMT30_05025 [Candidatus Saccharimonadia bacterium]|nr:hypothetical protein [Candidatus Saccharimonadia bacterium]
MSNVNATQEVIIVIGDASGDGGHFVVTPHGVKRVPDNNPGLREAYKAIAKNYAILQKAALDQKLPEQNR